MCSLCGDGNNFFLNNKLFGLCKGKKTEKINFEKFSFKTFSFLTCKTLKEDLCKKNFILFKLFFFVDFQNLTKFKIFLGTNFQVQNL